MSEHSEQVLVCQYLDLLKLKYFSIPNGFKYHGILRMLKGKISAFLYNKINIKIFKEVKEMKAEGMKNGIPDLFICEPNAFYHGLFIEMKDVKGGKTSPAQVVQIGELNNKDYLAVVCKGFVEAKNVIDKYKSSCVFSENIRGLN
jgi:hypothetical protein